MDPFALVGIVAVVGTCGYIAAAQKYAKHIRLLQQQAFSSNVESISRFAHAARETLVEDYGHAEEEAIKKLFARCAQHGMSLVSIDPKTGESKAVKS